MSEIKIIKKKLELYGIYLREQNELKDKLNHIIEVMNDHAEYPKAGARLLGYKAIDNKHTEVERMILDKTAIEARIIHLDIEIGHLRIEKFLDSLNEEQLDLIEKVYFQGMSYDDIAILTDYSKSGVAYKINEIFKRLDAFS